VKLELPAPAKLNRFLHITGQRADGYHQLQTVFQLVSRCDSLVFERADEGIEVSVTGATIDSQDNLVFQAATQLAARCSSRVGVRISLSKEIPIGAGMGGGSSDAATTLHGLNLLWNLGLSHQELAQIGLTLGADVPVFVAGQTCWAEGIGEILTPLELPESLYVVLMPDCVVATRDIFTHPDLTRDTSPITIARFLGQGQCRNDCESVSRSLYPEIGRALDWLSQWGTARMTGTGAAVFLEVRNDAQARDILAKSRQNWFGFVTRGLQQSPLIRAIDQAQNSFLD
jgi:4-diphosphocytidyl-2-C-methyl-D-erythritol kinase